MKKPRESNPDTRNRSQSQMKELRELRDKLVEIRIAQQEQVERILARHEGGDDYQNRKPDKKLRYIIPQDSIDPDIERRLEKIYPRVEAKIRRQRKKNEEKEQRLFLLPDPEESETP